MKNVIFSTVFFLTLLGSSEANGQDNAFQFNPEDFRELHQLQGKWKGMAGNTAFFERYQIKNDTLILIGNFSDAGFTNSTGRGQLYYKDGNIFHTSGSSKWKVSKRAKNSWHFEPVQNTSNKFSWTLKNPSEWTATVGSRNYEMKKIK